MVSSLLLAATLRAQSEIEAPQPKSGPNAAAQSQENAVTQAKSSLDSGDLAGAEKTLRDYLQAYPDSADAHFLLGLVLFRQVQAAAALDNNEIPTQAAAAGASRSHDEKVKASLAEFTAGAKYRKPSAADLKIVALDYVLLGDYSDADKWLTRMLEWNPNDAEGWYYLGRTKYNENRFAEAVEAFQRCLSLDPRNVKAKDNLGLAYAALGHADDAMAAFQAAIEWQKASGAKDPAPFIDIGNFLLDQNRAGDALPYLQQAIEMAPRNSRAHELLGKAYTRLDRFQDAQNELEAAIALAPGNANLYCMIGPVYRKQNQAEKSDSALKKCAKLAGSHSVSPTPRP
jgi:tetratricopeptide (TPR) repeat protein